VSIVKTVFMFSGQESKHVQMGRELFEKNEILRRSMLRLDALVQVLGGRPVIEAIYSGSKSDLFDRMLDDLERCVRSPRTPLCTLCFSWVSSIYSPT
jgi:acyl transferase domain-containing protein